MREPVTTLDPRYSDDGASPTPWAVTSTLLQAAELAWLVTVRPDGRPHATPVVPVWAEDALHFTTGEDEQKGANLRANDRVLLQVGRLDWERGIDVVVEGQAKPATDPAVLGGQYYGPDGLGQTRGYPKIVGSSKKSHDAERQRRLWAVSEELTGVTYPIG